MDTAYYSFWLVPQSPDLEDFQVIINTLAKRFGTVSFCPHVTLYSGPMAPDFNIQAALAQLASIQALELEIVGVQSGPHFAKGLYVQLQSSPILSRLVSRLVNAVPEAQPPVLEPHVSLLYHHLDDDIKQDLSRAISLSRPAMRFDQVQVIAAPQTFETQEHVSSLRCVHSQRLSQ